jgi:hypothetical protein
MAVKGVQAREQATPGFPQDRRSSRVVIPAEAGIQKERSGRVEFPEHGRTGVLGNVSEGDSSASTPFVPSLRQNERA